MYNHTGLQGRLTADPELRYTQQGTAITSFTLASDTGRKTKDGKNVPLWMGIKLCVQQTPTYQSVDIDAKL